MGQHQIGNMIRFELQMEKASSDYQSNEYHFGVNWLLQSVTVRIQYVMHSASHGLRCLTWRVSLSEVARTRVAMTRDAVAVQFKTTWVAMMAMQQ